MSAACRALPHKPSATPSLARLPLPSPGLPPGLCLSFISQKASPSRNCCLSSVKKISTVVSFISQKISHLFNFCLSFYSQKASLSLNCCVFHLYCYLLTVVSLLSVKRHRYLSSVVLSSRYTQLFDISNYRGLPADSVFIRSLS